MKYQSHQIVGTPLTLWLASWEGIQEGDDVPAWSLGGIAATVQVSGKVNQVDILGRISGNDFFVLNDYDTMPLVFSVPGIKTCEDMFVEIKPKKTGPGAANVSMIIRRN